MRTRMARAGVVSVTAAMITMTAGLAQALPPASTIAAASPTIVYQCGTDVQICAVSPSGGASRTLDQKGYLAGLTTDGTTYGYLSKADGTLYEAPVAGGAPTQANTAQQASPIAAMSPDGQHFLTQLNLSAGQYVLQYDVASGPSSSYTSIDSSTTGTLTYGWLGDTPLTAHADYAFSAPSYVCIGQQAGYCDVATTSPQIADSTQVVAFPSGSPDGTRIVADLAASGQDTGAIALYDAQTGGYLKTIASPPSGTAYSLPQFSPDGSRVVFESSAVDAGGNATGAPSIDVVNLDGSGLTTIASGSHPFWGGSASTVPPPTHAPKPSLRVPHQRLSAVSEHKRITTVCTLPDPARCGVKARITAKLARHLHLKVGAHASTYPLGSAVRTLSSAGHTTVTIRLNHKVAKALTRVDKLPVTLVATSSESGLKPRTVTRRVTFR